MPSLLEKYQAAMLLHALGDTIGFKNGDWEFNYNQKVNFTFTLEIIYEFIRLGGINEINLKGWSVSDDTILHLKLGEVLVKNGTKSTSELIKITGQTFLEAANDGLLDERFPGRATIQALHDLDQGIDYQKRPYDTFQGGSGVSMRNPVVGLRYPGEKNRRKLIRVAVATGIVTHKGGVGFLGGLVAALFTAFAIEGKSLVSWPREMLKVLKGDILDEIVKQLLKPNELDAYRADHEIFVNKWRRYIDEKFTGNKIVENRAMQNFVYRMRHYHDLYGFHRSKSIFPGGGGDDSVIIAYDSLVDCNGSWESLVFYSMLHIGDSDTTGCLAGCWFGTLYGLDRVPKKNLEHLEFKKELTQTANGLYQLIAK